MTFTKFDGSDYPAISAANVEKTSPPKNHIPYPTIGDAAMSPDFGDYQSSVWGRVPNLERATLIPKSNERLIPKSAMRRAKLSLQGREPEAISIAGIVVSLAQN